MKKIAIKNRRFGFDVGCRLLKLTYDKCPFEELEEFWDSIIPLTFADIAGMDNLEDRRVAMLCFGLERLVKEVNPTLADKTTLKKTTTWVNEKGETETISFEDTYELYTVSCEALNKGQQSWNKMQDVQFIKCKDTSTNRDYLIWIDNPSVAQTNKKEWISSTVIHKINAIQAIAWTIMTNIPEGEIIKIVRQGDCILIKPKKEYKALEEPRHLTEKEYRKFLVLES